MSIIFHGVSRMIRSNVNLKSLLKVIFIHPNWIIGYFRTGSISDIPKRYLYRLLPKDPVIIEAGCADGRDTAEFAKKFTLGQVYGVEPHPELFNLATKNTIGFSNVKILNYALGDTNSDKVDLYTGDSENLHQSSSLLRPTNHLSIFSEIDFSNKIEVKSITLSSLMKNLNLDFIDLLWLDLQGFELKILEESSNIMSKIKVIYLEVHKIELYENSPIIDQIQNFMHKNNFKCIMKRVPFISGNAVYVNNTFYQ
jgi:FkbM family methyltransferase